MKNVKASVSDKNVLTVEVDLNQSFGASKSGKTVIVASTEGNEKMKDHNGSDFMIGLNAYRYPGN